MRALTCLVAIACVAGCSVDRCKKDTVLLTLTLQNGAEAADSIDITLAVDSGAAQTKSLAHSPGSTSGSVEVDFGQPYPAGHSLTFTVTARVAGNVVATASQMTAATPTCTAIPLTLDGAIGDLGGSDQAAPDMGGIGSLTFAPICFSDNWCWSHPLPQGNLLRAVWEVSPTEEWFGGAGGTILHAKDGIGAPVASGTTADLYGMWAAAPDDIWAVGLSGAAVHWNGTAWSPSTTTTLQNLEAVSGTAANDVWASGTGGTIVHFDGTKWSASTSNTTANLLAVFARAPDDVWAVGTAGAIVHWNGSQWSSTTPIVTGSLSAVRAIAPNDVWAAGSSGALLHWNGTTWTMIASGTTAPLIGIWSASASDVWIVGSPAVRFTTPTALHWDGKSVAPVSPAPPLVPSLLAIHGSSSSDLWAVGGSGAIVHWDGTAWTASSTPLGVPGSTALWAGSATNVWAGGTNEMLHWNGASWAALPIGVGDATTLAFPYATSSAVGSDVWTVGALHVSGGTSPDTGFIVHYDGTSWKSAMVNGQDGGLTTLPQLFGVHVVDATHTWAVGEAGTILRFNGTSWTATTVGTNDLYGVWSSTAANDAWAVGDQGTILHFDPSTMMWTTVASGTTQPLGAIAGYSSSDLWAVGGGGTVLHYTNSTWTPVSIGTTAGLGAIDYVGPSEIWVAGFQSDGTSTVLLYDGGTWWPASLGTFGLSALSGSSSSGMWGVGTYGVVHRAPPSGPFDMARPPDMVKLPDLS